MPTQLRVNHAHVEVNLGADARDGLELDDGRGVVLALERVDGLLPGDGVGLSTAERW